MSVARLHLVDGTYELYRAHFSPRPDHLDPNGADRKATVGLVASLLSLLSEAEEAVTHLAVAFDNPIRSFRNDLFPEYKSDEGVPPELRAQFDPVEEAVRALGVTVWSMDEHEADDALATGARRFAEEVGQVRIMTPGQGSRAVPPRRSGGAGRSPAAQGHRRGDLPRGARLRPRQRARLPGADRRHRRRDPGAARIRREGASLLIGAYAHIEAIPDQPLRWTVKPRGALQLAATLAAQREEALFYRRLATLVDTVPLAESLDELRFRGVPRGALRGLVRRGRREHAPDGAETLERRLSACRRCGVPVDRRGRTVDLGR